MEKENNKATDIPARRSSRLKDARKTLCRFCNLKKLKKQVKSSSRGKYTARMNPGRNKYPMY